MGDNEKSPTSLKRSLGLGHVFVISTGGTISAGLFFLPSFAAAKAGPSAILAYLIAGLLALPAMLSVAELSTAMPRAGGLYYFLARALGPAGGTVTSVATLAVTSNEGCVCSRSYERIFSPDRNRPS